MTGQTDLQAAVIWLAKLALLTSGGRSPISKTQIGLYAQTLTSEIPTAAFCDASLTALSADAEHFPSYKVLREALITWHSLHAAGLVAPGPVSGSFQEYLDRQEDNEDHKTRVAAKAERVKADWSDPAKVRARVANLENAGPAFRSTLGRMLGLLVRLHAPENLGHVPPEFHPVKEAVR